MEIEFDPHKDRTNIDKHGISLGQFDQLDFKRGIFREDQRYAYGEKRVNVLAPIQGRLHAAVYTVRNDIYRVISLRKANAREWRMYEDQSNRDNED